MLTGRRNYGSWTSMMKRESERNERREEKSGWEKMIASAREGGLTTVMRMRRGSIPRDIDIEAGIRRSATEGIRGETQAQKARNRDQWIGKEVEIAEKMRTIRVTESTEVDAKLMAAGLTKHTPIIAHIISTDVGIAALCHHSPKEVK